MTEDIWAGDHLNRKEDAQFLTAYLLQRNKLAVAAGDKGTSINVSAQWGAGKTFFLTRLARQLRHDGYRVAEVNAWRDDHADDPIFAVMAAVLKALGKKTKAAKVGKTLIDSAGRIAIRALKGGVKRAAAIVIAKDDVDGIADEITKALTDAGEETIEEFADKALKHFEDGQKAIDEFRSELATAVQGQMPLFVLVDELDRCRPTYAVALLERIKHLFDVPNVVFVFGTHSGQLTHTIRAVYGVGFDAERYLHRFFDKTYKFDPPSILAFVQQRWKQLGFHDERFLHFHRANHAKCIAKISEIKGLSLRDIDQCLEMLWSIKDLVDPKIPIPLLYLYPLIAAYHLGQDDAFAYACGEGATVDGDHFRTAFSTAAIVSWQRYAGPDRGQVTEQISLAELISNFHTILSKGVAREMKVTNQSSEYVEQFRMQEFSVVYPNSVAGNYLESSLTKYGSLVRRASKVRPADETDEDILSEQQ